MLSLRYPMEVPLAGDSAETLRALLPLLERKADRSWRTKIEQSVQQWWQQVAEAATQQATPVNPRLIFEKLSPRLPDNVLVTIQRYWQQWHNSQLIILVLNNRDLNFVTWEQRLMQGEPRFAGSQEVPAFNYAQYAQSVGLAGGCIETPDQISPALDYAFQADRPVVIDALVDPNILVFNAKTAAKHAPNLAKAIAKGDTAAASHLGDAIKAAL